MTNDYTAQELATLKGCNIHTVYRTLRNPARRAAELPGSEQRIENGKAVWRIPVGVAERWTPRRVGYQRND